MQARQVQPVLRFQQPKGQTRVVTALPGRKLSDNRRHQGKPATDLKT